MNVIQRLRKAVSAFRGAAGVESGRGWTRIFSQGLGWQADKKLSRDDLFTSSPVYACTTLIASDIGKLLLRLMSKTAGGIWVEADSPSFSPVLRKPNHYQTRQQFIECWILSKLLSGNAYILKKRDARQVVVALYVLDPSRVTPLVAPNGDVFYRLSRDDLSKLPFDDPAVPASEIIHDRMECLFHPLVGISPLIAAALAAEQGIRILQNSGKFFANNSRPGGILTAPGTIDEETAKRLKKEFEQNFSGENFGRLMVAGDGLEYQAAAMTAENAQLVEQLGLSAEQVCMAFHVPAYMIGAGSPPSYDNISALNQQYYSQCLQKLINAVEDLLDDGLSLMSSGYRTEFDIDDLLRMDMATRIQTTNDQVKGGYISPDEARARFGMLPVPGGASPMMQQQNYSLAALAKRDAREDPFASGKEPATAPEKPSEQDEEEKASASLSKMLAALTKGLEHV